MGLFSFLSADSGNPGYGVNPPPPPPAPVSTAPLRSGIYLRPWTESPSTLAALPDLRPGVMRINYPAFPLIVADQTEAARLVGLIEGDILYARSIFALPLIVTTLKARRAPATAADIINDAIAVSDFYEKVAARFPGCAWELGNEQEIISGGGDSPLDAATYAYAFNRISDTIRMSDSTAIFVTAGTSGFNGAWIRAVLALTKPDVVGVHPYGTAPKDYAKAVWQLNAHLPVWFTEFGLQNISPQQVSDYFTFSRGTVPLAVLFCLSDLSADNGETFGLIDAHGNRRLSYAAAKTAFARA